jgi:rare lipoprotein A
MNDYRDVALDVARRASALARDAPDADEDSRIRVWWSARTWMTTRSWWAIGLAALLMVIALPMWRLVADRSVPEAQARVSSAPPSGSDDAGGTPHSGVAASTAGNSGRDSAQSAPGTATRTRSAETSHHRPYLTAQPAPGAGSEPGMGRKETAAQPPSTAATATVADLPDPADVSPPATQAAPSTTITLQVASFRSRGNAGRALAELQRAAIDGAHLQQVRVGGKAFWRLRVGPIDAARVPDVAARIARLGFDQPQPVRITSLDDGAR